MTELPRVESAEDTFEKNQETIRRVYESLYTKYPEQRELLDSHPLITLWLGYLEHWKGDLELVKGTRVLDIACGNLQPTEGDMYLPWFPRVLHELGAHVAGIDIGDLEGEPYEHYKVDLTRKDALAFLPDHSFDLVHMNSFVGRAPSPILKSVLTAKQTDVRGGLDDLKVRMQHEMERVVKEDGLIMNLDARFESRV